MVQTPSPEPSARVNSLCQRLLISQTCLYCILAPAGAVYLFLQFFSGAGFWLCVMQLILSATCIALAFVENSLRCHGQVEKVSQLEGPPALTPPRRILPAGLQAWLNHFSQHLLVTAVFVLMATVFAIANLVAAPPVTDTHTPDLMVIGLFVVLSFALLVVERMLSFKAIRALQYQREHVGLARIMLCVLLLITVALITATTSVLLALWLIKLASFLTLLVALEYLFRTFAALVAPLPADNRPRFLTRSFIIALYQWPPRPLAFVLDTLEQRFGVDIRQIQAFRLIGRRVLPVTCAMAVLGWLLSGLTEVQLHQRGIYERFGRPTAVLSPGLHVGLPWPLGRVIAVENGTVHELQLGDIADSKQNQPEADSAEGPAPQSSWRLWDNNHTADQSQVIASTASASQNFQIVNMDIRLIWRVGLTDNDALSSQYQTESLPTLIRSIARQVLVKQFASEQLDALLTEQQATLAATLNQQIQQRLNALHTGVELLFTRIEAIHPPSGAADAWHGVQAAQIAENALIAREKGYAASVVSEAKNQALTHINDAQAKAAENLAQAQSAATRFTAEHQAWQQAGDAFVTERRYQILSQALAHTPLLILDSQLQGAKQPVLDFRQYPALSDSTAPQKASAK